MRRIQSAKTASDIVPLYPSSRPTLLLERLGLLPLACRLERLMLHFRTQRQRASLSLLGLVHVNTYLRSKRAYPRSWLPDSFQK